MRRAAAFDKPPSPALLHRGSYVVGDVAERNMTREEEFLRPLDFEHAVFFSDVDTMLSRKGAPLSSAAWVPKVSFVNSWRLWVWSVSADVAALLSLLVLLSLFRALFVAAVIHAMLSGIP